MYKQLPSEQRYTISVLLSKGLKKKLSWIIKKDYGNNYPYYCVLHLFLNEIAPIQGSTIKIQLLSARFSKISRTEIVPKTGKKWYFERMRGNMVMSATC